jgi:hypothetical protein
MPLNKEFLIKLIKELRSKKHKQHFGGSYRGSDGSKCIMALAYDVSEIELSTNGAFLWDLFYNSTGFSSGNLDLDGSFPYMNDSGVTFLEFADILERRLINDES